LIALIDIIAKSLSIDALEKIGKNATGPTFGTFGIFLTTGSFDSSPTSVMLFGTATTGRKRNLYLGDKIALTGTNPINGIFVTGRRKELFGRTDIFGTNSTIITTVTNGPGIVTGSFDSSVTSLPGRRIVTTGRKRNLDRSQMFAKTRTDVINVIHGATPSIVRT
jgi:hypothetical protein